MAGWGGFFFQAEDGIRGLYVTGVQTCALPISLRTKLDGFCHFLAERCVETERDRSEERRVGKECSCRWWRYHEKKKNLPAREPCRSLIACSEQPQPASPRLSQPRPVSVPSLTH